MSHQKESKGSGSSIFKEFYEKLQDPKSEEIRQLFQRFVENGFKPRAPREEMAKQIREIVELLFENFADIWKIRSKVILEGMEQLVTKNLYKILRLRRESEINENEILEKKMKIIGSFIQPEHLDIDPKRLNHARVDRAINELQKMNKFKAPRDKMVLIMNSCKIIGLMLKETNKSKVAEGADMFFPCIIYILLKGCPKDIKAHVDYIKLYRNPELLESEDDYFLTTISSAIDFVSNMIGDDLNMGNSEYKDLYEKYAQEKGEEINQRSNRRKEMKNQRNYDEYENQSEISCITTQSNAQILGELEEMDVPVVNHALTINKGVQTELREEEKEAAEKKSQASVSTTGSSNVSNPALSKIESKIIADHEEFWAGRLKEDFEEMTIGDMKEMHSIMLNLKKIMKTVNSREESPNPKALPEPKSASQSKKVQNEELYEIFAGETAQKATQNQGNVTLNNGLDGLDDLFS